MQAALQQVWQQLASHRDPESGVWTGELSSSALSTATAISALAFVSEHRGDTSNDRLIDAGITWLADQQNADGGFGDTPLSHSNIATTMLTVAAVHACGRQDDYASVIEAAQKYIDAAGDIAGLRKRYGKDKTFAVPILAHCAMAGIVPWREVSALPFEAACVSQRFYRWLQLPVVSYAIPALVAIGIAKFKNDPPWDPVRRLVRRSCVARALSVLERMQPASGGFLEAIPLTSFVVMGLVKSGFGDHPVVNRGIEFLQQSVRVAFRSAKVARGNTHATFAERKATLTDQKATLPDRKATLPERKATLMNWPIDTNLATWCTTLSINAIAGSPELLQSEVDRNPQSWRKCAEWLLNCQNQTIHPFTGSPPGGWGWTDLSGAVPDADDTPGAMIALKNLSAAIGGEPGDDELQRRIAGACHQGSDWLLKLQNRDDGWPTFCRGWGRFPFDRSGSDITAHVIRGLLAWQDGPHERKILPAIDAGFQFMDRQQRPDGSWLPLWFGNQDTADEINPCYGTSKVLFAYRDAGRLRSKPAINGLGWLVVNQNADGGWGGGESSRLPKRPGLDSRNRGSSSVEETALCTAAMIDASLEFAGDTEMAAAARRGLDWLRETVNDGHIDQPSPIGFYFAKLWYYEQLYPLIFATEALAKATGIEAGAVAHTANMNDA